MAQIRPEFGRNLRETLQQRRLSYRDVQRLTGIGLSQIGDLCGGLVRTRAQIERLVAGLGLDPLKWMVEAGFVPEGIGRDALLQGLMQIGEVAPLPHAALARPTFERVSAGPGALPPDAPAGPTGEVLAPYDYTVRVRGDSMEGVLEDGDLAFVKQQDSANPDDLVVALVRDTVVVKRFRKRNGMITLASANDRYEEIPASEVRILGIVTGIYRRP